MTNTIHENATIHHASPVRTLPLPDILVSFSSWLGLYHRVLHQPFSPSFPLQRHLPSINDSTWPAADIFSQCRTRQSINGRDGETKQLGKRRPLSNIYTPPRTATAPVSAFVSIMLRCVRSAVSHCRMGPRFKSSHNRHLPNGRQHFPALRPLAPKPACTWIC